MSRSIFASFLPDEIKRSHQRSINKFSMRPDHGDSADFGEISLAPRL
jgi:hypothetical protein